MLIIRITGKAKDVFPALRGLVLKHGGNTPVVALTGLQAHKRKIKVVPPFDKR